jgi:heme oxygenase
VTIPGVFGAKGADVAPADGRPALVLLRERTRTEHDAVERVLDLMSDALTLRTYVRTLERFHGFWQPVERRLQRIVGLREIGLDLAERERAPLLVADLRALGIADPAALPLCEELPGIDGVPAALGCLYVLEGSSLGGQVIRRHAHERLGITEETGGRFFQGYGERTGEMWRAFSAAVNAFPAGPAGQESMVEAAISTFRSLRRWCEREETLALP